MHSHKSNLNARGPLGATVFVSGSLMLAEVVGGLWSGSLALLAFQRQQRQHTATKSKHVRFWWLWWLCESAKASKANKAGFARFARFAGLCTVGGHNAEWAALYIT